MILYRSYLPTCTLGRLIADKTGELICYTVEKPWAQNKRFVSCIPEGVYSVKPYASPTFGQSLIIEGGTVGLTEDSERYGVLFHPANAASQLEGCIAPGMEIKPMYINNQWQTCVTQSRNSMKNLLAKYEPELIIETYTPFDLKN